MNALLRLRKDMVISNLVPFKYLLYAALLSNVTSFEEDGVKHGVYEGLEDLGDFLSEWDDADLRRSSLHIALKELADEGLIFFDSDNSDIVYLGEFRGRKFFTFEVKNSLYDKAKELLFEQLTIFSSAKSAISKSRGRFLTDRFSELLDKGVETLTPGDFTDIHGYLYEIYTGGEVYILRNKVEYFQTNNMLKAYDKFTTFSILVEGVLNYDSYKTKGVPTLTNVACMKDDVFRKLTKPAAGSKEYMRDISTKVESEF